jgi:hypothetical protein
MTLGENCSLDLSNLSLATLRNYRDFVNYFPNIPGGFGGSLIQFSQVFASAVVNLSAQSILSFDDHERWVSPTGITFFMEWVASNGSGNQTLSPGETTYTDLGEVPMGQLKRYRECVSFKNRFAKALILKTYPLGINF